MLLYDETNVTLFVSFDNVLDIVHIFCSLHHDIAKTVYVFIYKRKMEIGGP
jgi:hypothetical protein